MGWVKVDDLVYGTIAKHLDLSPHYVKQQADEELEMLGLETGRCRRVLADIGRVINQPTLVELPDEHLLTPNTLRAAVSKLVNAGVR